MISFYFCVIIHEGSVVLIGADPLRQPPVPETNFETGLILVGEARGESANAADLFPLCSWSDNSLSIEGCEILSYTEVA
jgi:hypothetical protein